MADQHFPYKFKPALQGQNIADAEDVELLATYVGVLTGATDTETALQRIDATGQGSRIRQFTGSFTADGTNITEWFGGRQLTRLRCTDSNIAVGQTGTVTFQLPGSAALNTAFDQLQTAGVEEVIRFIIEYTGPSKDRLSIIPRPGATPIITGQTNIIVRTGIAAEIEVTRTSGTISDYVFQAIGGIGDGGELFDAIRLQNPASVVWDASSTGTLPTQVAKGSAYKVVNAPTDGSGRFGEVMYTDDWVVWEGETFTAWATEPHQWFVMSAHDVRRITALETDFLTDIAITAQSDRNGVTRGANYADTAGEIRLKIYNSQSDYSAADLNTTGDIDEYTDTSDATGVLAIRLSGTRATLLSVLPTLYVYVESSGTFTRLFNLNDDFAYQGDFGSESDYVSINTINYTANDTIRIYIGSIVDRYNAPNFDVFESNLSDAVQAKLNRTDGNGTVDEQRLSALESKMDGLFPLTPDVSKLNDFADIYNDSNTVQTVSITTGYSLIADYRSSSDKYESSGVTYSDAGDDVVTYTGLSENLHRAFGFKVTAPDDEVLMWIVDGSTRIPFIDITSAGNVRINNYRSETTQGDHVTNQLHALTRTSGDEFISTATDSVSTFTITNFPSGATETSRSMQIEIDVAVNGTDTLAGHFQDIQLPADNTAQARQTFDASIPLGPLHGNRTVNVTIGYELRVSGSDLLIDFTLVSAPSDVTVRMNDVYTYLSYTPAATTTRVDNFVAFNDEGGTYTFTGEIDFIVSFQPHQFDNAMAAVAGAITSTGTVTLFNDITVPQPAHSFDSVEIPDDINFVTILPDHYFIHRDIGALLPRRGTKWAYGLALLEEVTEQQITEQVDFTQGIVLIDTVTSDRYLVTIANGTLKHEIIP